ncbi:1-acyl-sn-glycerol-3-phosphate acyltransferase [Rhodoferax koreense]|uniref:1-acyl-sn-glycerol-3-phosphate acyltransferase n=1 Tax=Rhodoferax koreensis TaxID=1842727 RepID=A0A1P8JT54_9BURK|nr:lysophospholipid acyltransferase family protein [Rhodoferax koreense]APW36905.1 1-acyl-sn-glycerol-3-phosphate acyltransferase [Rhodoferax koreense]
MRAIRATGKLGRMLAHLGRGLWTISRQFPTLDQTEKERLVQQWAGRMLGIMHIELRVSGEPPAHGPVLLVANHISWLDILVLHAAGYCRFVSKADVKHWPVVGTLATAAGTLYIERESRRDAMRVVHHMTEHLRMGDVVAVFPEGTTGDGITMLPFHANLLQAAVTADVPALPVALRFIDGRTGQTSFAPSFVGQETLVGSVWRTLSSNSLVAEVNYGEMQRAEGRSRREWAEDLQHRVNRLRTAQAVPTRPAALRSEPGRL